jgi:hypothetical protein
MRRTVLRWSSVLALVVAGVAATSSPVTARPLTHSTNRHVIVVLRVQHRAAAASDHARAAQRSAYAANRRTESDVVARARSNGARNVHAYGLISAFSATVSSSEESALARDPAVARVFPDLRISMGPSQRQQIGAEATGQPKAVRRAAAASSGPICPADPSHPLLEPEALGVTHTAFDDPSKPQAQNIVDGTGIKVAWIADGIDINNPDFVRGDGTHVFIDYKDFSGDGLLAATGGAEAFGDASAIAAQGLKTYDLASFVNPAHPLPPGCNIKIRGVAPGASLIGLKVFGNSSFAPTSHFIDAIDYAVSDGADVLNESFGANPFPDSGTDPITLADNAAIAAGVTVVASTGDAGTTGTVGSPASDPRVIGVGASTTFQSYIQDTTSGAQFSDGTWVSDNISGLSSGGITQAARTPDLVAPGDLNWALCTANTALYTECTNDVGSPSPIQDFGGTSQSSPLTAGAAALVIEAYENTHHGARPRPALVKRLLTSTATDLGHPAYEQGAGLLNTLAAVHAAESWHDAHGSPKAVGRSLVVDQTQLSAIGGVHAVVSKRVTVHNVSTHTVTVHASTRELGKAKTVARGDVALNTATAPTYVDSFGIARSYATKSFAVPSGRDRLDVTIAAQTSPAAIRIILLDPSGAYTAYSIPQGAGNWAHVDVRRPGAGNWTAILALSQSSGFDGPVHFRATTSNYTTAKAWLATPRFKLAPGKSHTEVVGVREPGHPGDVSASVQLKELNGPTTSVPLTERAVVSASGGTFTDTISGGNGRGSPGLSKFYYLDVPHGAKDVNVGIKLSDPNEMVFASLSGPDGQVASYQSNVNPPETALVKGIQLVRGHPKPGRWVLGLAVQNPASGTAVSSPFTVKVAYHAAQVHGSPPNSKKTKLKAGKAVTVPVQIKNTGTSRLVYFVDPRLDATGRTSLAELSGVSQPFPLPQPSDVAPFWLVPTECTSLTDTATADQPVNLDFFYESGEPDVYGSHVGNGAKAATHADQVSPGIWEADVGQVGPFSEPGDSTPGSVSLSASARCRLFDPAVTTSAGDFWQEGVTGQSAGVGLFQAHLPDGALPRRGLRSGSATPSDTGPLVLAPGQTGKIVVTITPSGAPGKVVTGHLYVDTVDSFTDGGNELAGIPYAYTIK